MNTIIISPAFNVSSKVHLLLDGLTKYKENTVIINDGSTDETAKIIERSGFKCLHHDRNLGVSSAIYTGLKYALSNSYDSAIILDADGQHNPEYIPEFSRLLDNYYIVIGNRFFCPRNVPTSSLASNAIASMLIKKIFGSNILDISCGFKAFHIDDRIMEVIEKSASYSFIFDLLISSLAADKSVGSVNIDCIYHYSDFQSTGRMEIVSFIKCMRRFISCVEYHALKLHELFYSVTNNRNFVFTLGKSRFYGFYMEQEDGYIIQTNPAQLFDYVESIV